MATYYVSPNYLRNFVLLLSSLIFYYIGATNIVFYLIGLCVLNYYFAVLIRQDSRSLNQKKALLTIVVALNLGGLIYFKYAYFFAGIAANLFAPTLLSLAETTLSKVILPIGISFYTFQAISYQIDNYREDLPVPSSLINFATYLTMFPQLIAGPIVRYSEVEKRLENRKHTLSYFQAGMFVFIFGLGKKFF